MRIHLKPAPGLPYAPCGARVKWDQQLPKRMRTRLSNVTGNPHEVNCASCQRTHAFTRARILALPNVTPVIADDHVQYRYLLGDDGHYHDVKVGPFTPPPGGTWPYGDWKQPERDYTGEWAEPSTHVLLGYTGYSDYSGSSCERSNNEALRDDYSDTFTEAVGGHGTSELMLSVDWRPPADGREGLLDDLEKLADYPLYSEEHHSQLEMTEAWEAWDSFAEWDLKRKLDDLAAAQGAEDSLTDALEAIETLSGQHWIIYPALICECGYHGRTWDEMYDHSQRYYSLRDMFYAADRDMPESPYLEDAVNIVFPYFDKMAQIVYDQIWELRCTDLPQTPAWYNPAQGKLAGMPAIPEETS